MILAYSRNVASFFATLLLCGGSLRAEDGDDTLRYYLSRSRLVVSGEIANFHGGIMNGSQVHYGCTLNVRRMLSGSTGGKEIGPGFLLYKNLFKQDVDRHPEFLKEGGQAIFFVRRGVESRGEGRGWMAVNPWFAVQPASEAMEKALARLAPASGPAPQPVDVGESGEATLRYYKSKASLVVSGEITKIESPTYADRRAHRSLRVEVTRIMRGGVQGDEIEVSVVRFEKDKTEAPAFLKAGKRVILFLREQGDGYQTVDPWFGVQPYNSVMEEGIDSAYAEKTGNQ